MTIKINADGTFAKDFKVEYDRIAYNLMLKPQKAIELCQNIAVDHSDAAGYTVDYFREHHFGWVITGWHVVFSRLPNKNEDFKISTWTKLFRRLQADRSFIATDSDGNELYRTMSRWFLMDIDKRRPMRLPENFLDRYVPSTFDNVIENEDYSHPSIDLFSLKGSRNFTVTRRDIDSNNHTNNISYLDWAMDDISDDIYSNYNIYDLRAIYEKEAVKGDLIRSDHYTRIIEDGVETSSIFINPLSDVEYCRVTIQWKSK